MVRLHAVDFVMQKHRIYLRQSGATLIEVLVSVVITSVGLLGLAGLMATTARVNQGAYQRTQVGFAVQALIESMHVNPNAVARGRYDGIGGSGKTSGADCRKGGCNPELRADYDLAQFHRALADVLPHAQASLKCRPDANGAVVADVYDGLCRIEVNWSERTLARGGAPEPQSLVWVFQP